MTDTFAPPTPISPISSKPTGTIQIGHHHEFPVTSFIRAMDIGSMIWESADDYPTFDAALADLDSGLGEWIAEMGL